MQERERNQLLFLDVDASSKKRNQASYVPSFLLKSPRIGGGGGVERLRVLRKISFKIK